MNRGKALSARLLGQALAGRVLGTVAPVVADEVRSLTAFKRKVYKRYDHAPHLTLLDDRLEQVSRYIETGGREGIGRLIISIPPRHGKSMTTSRLYPAWFLGRNPAKRVMMVSYGQDLVNKHSRAARNFVASPVYGQIFPNVKLADDSKSMSEWDIAGSNGEGGVSALGILGAATGKGAHLLLIDDPHKNRQEVESVLTRGRVWEAFTGDLYDRLEPGGAIIIMATRWHEDDLTGRALRLMAHEGWEVLNLPALAKGDDPLGRLPGQALWPARYDVPALSLRRQSVGEYEWAAKYEGEPRPSEGGIFKPAWFKPFVQVLPPVRFAVRYWDLAMSSRTAADYTVGVRLAECADGLLYITGIVREQVELADLPALLRDTMLGDGAGIRQGFENKGYMVRAIQDLVKDRQMRQYRIKGYEADTDKLTRALPLASQASLSRVRIYVGAGGVSLAQAEALLDEMASFPYGTHDDQVDALAGALLMSSEGLPGKRSAEVLTNVY